MRNLALWWCRLPTIFRAAIVGSVVLVAGGILRGPLIYANLKVWPTVPWSVILLAGYLWVFWQYLGGRWWPRSTSEARRHALRAQPLSRRVWFWALLAGYLGMVSSFALHRVVMRLTPLHYEIPSVLDPLSPVATIAVLLMLSAMAGVVEEAAFRGYMQGPIEKRHGVVVAIAVVSVVFGAAHLTDSQPQMNVARMFFIVLASVVYGILAHLVGSIRPGIVLHATGDAIGIGLIWWFSRSPARTGSPWSDSSFLIALSVAVVFGIGAVCGFRKLARVARPSLVVPTTQSSPVQLD